MTLEDAACVQSVYKSDTYQMDVLQLLSFIVHKWIKDTLSCVRHEKQFYTAGPVPWNGAGDEADRKPWISMPLSWNGFTKPTCITFLPFRLSTNVLLKLQSVGYSHSVHKTHSESWLITCVWFCNDHLLGQFGV